MKTNIFYRPPWTCGKYNSEKNVAIVFNLLSKMNYFYENESAEVINCILSVGRYGKVSVKEVSVKCNIDEESIYNFFNDLCSTGLLADSEITDEIVADYRNVCKNTSQNTTTIGTRAEELTRNGTTSAYMQ
ncbi:MAG: hypothetical protein IJ180_11440 [Bacteroidales bacterium]|nr:hypothetical protein [Bacteroidales bacterium]MBQ9255370.1 hypothetical protein [Bacteroidales bacterium]